MDELKGRTMNIQRVQIDTIPAILYGEPTKQGYLFLHGQMGRKEEAEAFAQVVCPKGYQVLSIDLPGHRERRGQGKSLLPWTAVSDIQAALNWVRPRWETVSLRANSIGAYFAMLAFDSPTHVLLVSPILDMEGLILAMMDQAGVSEDQLREQGEITTSSSQTLSWKYLCWVREHPVHDWSCHISILYGSGDNMTARRSVEEYSRQHNARLTVVEGAEHWFHTAQQLSALQKWEERES